MDKYRLLRQAVAAAGLAAPEGPAVADAATDRQLLAVHTPGYVERVVQGRLSREEVRRLGFPWSPELVERSRRSVGATLAACRAALADGVAVNLAGGTHHAFADRGGGYCVFNDAAVAAAALLGEGAVSGVAIIDCDVHQGDGTAAIFGGDPRVFTFSIHGRHNFPFHKETSDLDVPLADGTDDAAYLAALAEGLERTLLARPAELAIYVSGADPYAGDLLGRLALSKEGLAARDRLVLESCLRAGCAVAVTMAGGYAAEIADTVSIHLATVRESRRALDSAVYSSGRRRPRRRESWRSA